MSYALGSFNKWRGLNVTVDLIFEFFCNKGRDFGFAHLERRCIYSPSKKKKSRESTPQEKTVANTNSMLPNPISLPGSMGWLFFLSLHLFVVTLLCLCQWNVPRIMCVTSRPDPENQSWHPPRFLSLPSPIVGTENSLMMEP